MNALTAFFRVGPAQNDHLPALRVALGVGIPLIALLLIGRIDLAIYAVFGAFAGIYGRGDPHALRLQHQAAAGGVLFVAIAAGALITAYDAGPWVVVAGSALLAGLGSLAADRLMLRPPGPFFPVFAFASTASIPSEAPLGEALGAALVSIALSVAIGAAGWLHPRARIRPPVRRRNPAPNPCQAVVNAFRYALAAGVGGALATTLDIGHNYWAIISAIVPLAAATRAVRLQRGVHRVLGTVGGLGLTALLLAARLEPWQLVLVLIALQFATEMFVIRHYSLAMLFITPLALLMSELAAPTADPSGLLVDRLIETLIGVAVGMAVVLLIRDPKDAGR